jgi:hypothetical protein
MQITIFPDVKATSLQAFNEPWETFATRFIDPPRYPSKHACPLVKLATFGDVRTAAGCLRSESNMISVSGVCGDYDAGVMSPDLAALLLSATGILAVVYTSPSHTSAKPRWRVLAPLSTDYPVAARREFIGRVNAALGGVLASESYTAAQSFFISAVTGVEYEAHITQGAFVDWVGIDAVYPVNAAPIAPQIYHPDRDADEETLAELRSALTAISPDDYHEWTAVGIALSGIGEPGYELWAEWSATSNKHDADRDLAKWSTFHPDRTGFASIFSKAQACGWINPKARKPIDLTGMFGDTSVPARAAPMPARAPAPTLAPPTEALSEPPKPPKPTGAPPPAKRNINDAPTAITGSTLAFGDDQAKIFAGCAYVLDRDEVLLPNGTFANKSQFDNWYGKFSYVKSADNAGVEKSAWNAFVRSQLLNFPKAESYCFDPALEFGEVVNTPDGVVVNTFKPITTPSIEGDCSPILDHLHKILPVGDDAEIYLSYMAAMIQYPGRKIAWCPILQGTKGNGKSLIGELMERVMTFKYTHRPSGKDINNKFTGWLDRRLLIVLEELGVYEKRETLDTLKVMISGKRIEIQGKGKDQVTGENRANFLVFVNDKDAVPIDDDERRYASLFCAQQSAADITRDGMNSAYFKRLATWIETVGAAHFHHYLKNYKIQDRFNPAEEAQRAPLTSSRQEAIHASRGSVEAELLEMIESKARGFAGGWICSLDLDAMLKANRMEKMMPRQKRRAMLQSLGYDWHPALQLGRTNNPISGYGSKPVLFIKKGHPQQLLLTGAEVVKAYLDAQPVDGVAKSGLVQVFGHGGER